MRKSIRYYITTAGAEPTVRSVRVALSPADLAERAELTSPGTSEATPRRRRIASDGVRRFVKGAIEKRVGRG